MSERGRDLYALLGVSRSASTAEIRKTYKRLARKYHPDVNPGDKASEARFKEISRAADILTDPEKRKLYDRYGEVAFTSGFDADRAEAANRSSSRGRGTRGAPAFDFEDLGGGPSRGFEELFEMFSGIGGGGGGKTRPSTGESVKTDVTLKFSEAVRGTTIAVPVQRRRVCGACNGAGTKNRAVCSECRGSRHVVETERVKVRVPEGVDEGSRVRVAGKGDIPPGGGSAGDLLVIVHVAPHAHFQRTGDDIFTEVPVTVREAYLGAEIEIPTIQGMVRAKIPAGTTGGQKFRLRGRGVRNVQTRAYGDHVYRVNVVIPSVVTEAGRAAADRLEVLYGGPVRSHLPRKLEDPDER